MTAAVTDAAPAPVFDRPGRLERPASDWTRDEDTGRPLILPDPEWTPEQRDAWLARPGTKDGQRYYTRVTTFGEALLDGTMLAKWKMRRVALGMGRRPDYVVAAAGLTAEDRDKAALNDLAEKALEAAGPNAADIGTALHSFTERIDRGEPVGVIPPAYERDLDAYRAQVERIIWAHREERMVCDRLETAGTPDGIGMVDEPDPDGVVDLLRIIDLKTGNIETTAGKFSTQLGIYANSALYDAATGHRRRLENLDTRWGVVLHMPAGVGTAELRWLNLEHGWLGAQLAGPVRKWRTVNYADLYRPLVKPEPRVIEDGRCAGVKRDGNPCTYKAVSGGYCGRHQEQVGSDPDAARPVRVVKVERELQAALENVSAPLQLEQLPEPSTTVEPAVDDLADEQRAQNAAAAHEASEGQYGAPLTRCATTDLLVGQCACPAHRPDLATTGDDGVAPDEPRELGKLCRCDRLTIPHIRTADCEHHPQPRDRGRLQPDVEQNGNPTPHSSLGTPEDAKEAARKAELGLMDQVRACRTSGELEVLYQRTGFAWSDAVRKYASRHRDLLPGLAQQDRVSAALLASIRAAENGSQLHQLWEQHRDTWTDEHTAAAGQRAGQVPPF